MQTAQANVVVDVKQALSHSAGDELVSDIGGIPGVSHAEVSLRSPRLVLVDYDPDRIDSQHILDTVQRHGFDARLIGM